MKGSGYRSLICSLTSISPLSNTVRRDGGNITTNSVRNASATTGSRGESAMLSPEEERQRSALTRERLVAAALALINDEGLEGLSMRALADRLEVKAASLYWHVRDRRELLELLAEAILETVPRSRRGGDWRRGVLAAGDALHRAVAAQKDGDRILLEVPEALERSDTFGGLKAQLQGAGLQAREAGDVALIAMIYVIAGRTPAEV